MPCIPFSDGIGVTGFVCTGRGGRPKPCRAANCGEASVALCDWKLHKVEGGKRVYTGKTCDLALCARHRHVVGKHTNGEWKDLCPAHYDMAKRQGLVQP